MNCNTQPCQGIQKLINGKRIFCVLSKVRKSLCQEISKNVKFTNAVPSKCPILTNSRKSLQRYFTLNSSSQRLLPEKALKNRDFTPPVRVIRDRWLS